MIEVERTTKYVRRAWPDPIDGLDFELPPELEASAPPEARGLERDGVRLLVSYGSGRIEHARFYDLPRFLEPGDVLVINTSGTLMASLQARRANGAALELHLSTAMQGGVWAVEARRPSSDGAAGSLPFWDIQSGETLDLPAGGTATLHTPLPGQDPARPRLWLASLQLPDQVAPYLSRYGAPIRYGYVSQPWPGEYYQTVYATEPGSAEMPSAGRAFTPRLITRLVAAGILVVPLLLHTGVASVEQGEPPYDEYYRVPLDTARIVNGARLARRRVIAVGTTVVRALETVTDRDGEAHPGEGWTREVITPQRGVRAVDALLTGLHEPRATHLGMLEAIAGREHLRIAYAEALAERYLWHEFGDLHLILP